LTPRNPFDTLAQMIFSAFLMRSRGFDWIPAFPPSRIALQQGPRLLILAAATRFFPGATRDIWERVFGGF
jgi:hypothetical protein